MAEIPTEINDFKVEISEIYRENKKLTTTGNVFLMTAAVSLVSLGVATISTNLISGGIEFVLGVLAFIAYEKFPTSPTA